MLTTVAAQLENIEGQRTWAGTWKGAGGMPQPAGDPGIVTPGKF